MRVQYRIVWTTVHLAILFLAALLITSTAGSATCIDEDPTHCPTLDVMGCYDNLGQCCLSCSKFSTNLTGCEYGDQRSDCSAEVCSYAPTNYTNFQQQCCWTCHQLNLSTTSVSTLTAATATTGAGVPVKATATITVSLDTTAPPLITKKTPPTLPNLTQPPTSTTTSTTTTSPPVTTVQSTTTTSTQSSTTSTSTTSPQPSTTAATTAVFTSVTTSATSTVSTTSVPVSLTSSSDAPVNGASSSSQNQVIIGAAVGACLGVLLLVAIIVITVCCIKKRRNTEHQQQQNGYKNRMAESVLQESDIRQSGPKARPISEVVRSATVRGGASNFDKNKTYGASDTNTITPRTMYLSVGGKSAYDLMQEQDRAAGRLDDLGQGQDQGHQGQDQEGPSHYNNRAYDYVNNDGSYMNNPVATTSAAGLGGDADYVNTSNPESGSENELTTSSNLNFRF